MSIDPQTHTGTVALVVSDLDRSLNFYQDNIGLRLQDRSDGVALLGADARPLLSLTEQKDISPVRRGRTGLYHFALLLPSRVELARTLRHLIDTRTPMSGASDHGVSEALYLSDPDGHGIEIYRDRERSEWPIPANATEGARVDMVTEPFDFDSVLAEVTPGRIRWEAIADGTVMGHTHLHIANSMQSEYFYVDTLGFDLMQRFGSQASFISAGGYHHHIGLNTWAGIGAPPPPEDAARLLWYEILVPNVDAQQRVLAQLDAAGILYKTQDGVAVFNDPSQNTIHLVVEA